jgi:hypothetical protein
MGLEQSTARAKAQGKEVNWCIKAICPPFERREKEMESSEPATFVTTSLKTTLHLR